VVARPLHVSTAKREASSQKRRQRLSTRSGPGHTPLVLRLRLLPPARAHGQSRTRLETPGQVVIEGGPLARRYTTSRGVDGTSAGLAVACSLLERLAVPGPARFALTSLRGAELALDFGVECSGFASRSARSAADNVPISEAYYSQHRSVRTRCLRPWVTSDEAVELTPTARPRRTTSFFSVRFGARQPTADYNAFVA